MTNDSKNQDNQTQHIDNKIDNQQPVEPKIPIEPIDEDDDKQKTIGYDPGATVPRNSILNMIQGVPYPSEDVVFNPNLEKDPQEFDLSSITF